MLLHKLIPIFTLLCFGGAFYIDNTHFTNLMSIVHIGSLYVFTKKYSYKILHGGYWFFTEFWCIIAVWTTLNRIMYGEWVASLIAHIVFLIFTMILNSIAAHKETDFFTSQLYDILASFDDHDCIVLPSHYPKIKDRASAAA